MRNYLSRKSSTFQCLIIVGVGGGERAAVLCHIIHPFTEDNWVFFGTLRVAYSRVCCFVLINHFPGLVRSLPCPVVPGLVY